LLDNSEWLCAYGFIDFLRDVGKHFTVNQMTAKESVRSRLERPDQGISYTEFSYMLLQAYDYLYLHDAYGCRVQLGGSDQWGNITMGLELIRKVRGSEAFALTYPLLLRADGTKYGKSESGAVWLDATKSSPYEMYQFFVRTPDDEVGRLLRYFTFLSHEEIEALDVEVVERPGHRRAQQALARAVCALRPRRGRDRTRHCCLRSPVLRGGRQARRGTAPGGVRGRAVVEVRALVPRFRRVRARRSARVDGPCFLEDSSAHRCGPKAACT